VPLIAYQNAHGANDFPLHFALFEALERRGLLDRFDFALDPFTDIEYCCALVSRFPQLILTTEASLVSCTREFVYRRLGRGARAIAIFERSFDAVCEAPGGRIHPLYTGGIDIFWRYPRAKQRAILFHSIEEGILNQPETRKSVADTNLVIARSRRAARVARLAGASRVVESCDIVLGTQLESKFETGFAVALRVPNLRPTAAYFHEIRAILNYLEALAVRVDHVRMESPMDNEQIARGYGSPACPNIGLWGGSRMYQPFVAKREGVISSRLHTTLMALLAGNRKILQFQIESGTNKIKEILEDIGLNHLPVEPIEHVRLSTIREFVEGGNTLSQADVRRALANASRQVEAGLDAFEDWLLSLPKKKIAVALSAF
jgi:hypothetical protein